MGRSYLYIFPTFKRPRHKIRFWPPRFGISLVEKTVKWVASCCQCCGSVSGSGLDPDSMASLNPYPDHLQSGSETRTAKMTHKHRNKFFFFLKFWSYKTLDPDWIRIRIRIHLKCGIRFQLIRIHSSGCCIYFFPLNKINSPRKRI
jgi:hypothetical protein